MSVLILVLCLGIATLAAPGHAAPGRAGDKPTERQTPHDVPPRASEHTSAGDDPEHVRGEPLKVEDRAPLPSTKDALRRDYDDPASPAPRQRPSMRAVPEHETDEKGEARTAAVPDCDTSDFTGRTGSALVRQIKASTTDCVNTLFGLTGSDAHHAFREGQMTSVAYALRDGSASYPGDGSTGMPQLVLYLRAGYYVHWYHEDDTGPYGPTLRTAVRAGLDAFFAAPRSRDVTDANGEVLAEAVTLIDSAEENARYLYVVKRLLNGYDSSYNSSWWLLTAVNNVYTVLFRGHQVPAFVTAVSSDRGVLDALYDFASSHGNLLGTDQSYLTSNAGREHARFLRHASLRSTVRPQAAGLLNQSSIKGDTAPLWVGVAEMTDSYDKANCGYYGTCDLRQRLISEVLVVRHTCSAGLRIRAQQMSPAQLADTCGSLADQDAYFHGIAKDGGPVAGDRNTSLEVVVYDSSTDYRTYAGATWGIDTNNGGMYLEGDPSAAGNQARFIAYEAEWVRPSFEIWNLNHEYTHYLDGRFNLHGGFADNIATPTVWWIEGFAEYVSYSYRGLRYDAAVTEAGKRTYALSTLFDTTYSHDTTRVYRWGYLAVRYMLQSHRAEMDTVLGHYRNGDWNAARSYLTGSIGTRYDSDWYSWLSRCAAGDCGGSTNPPGNQAPTASFAVAVSGLTANFTDRSTDSDGTVAARSWNFGDGSTSTAANPAKTYTAAGTYAVKLTVTDDKGATGTATQSITVGGPDPTPECTGTDTRELDRNCRRGNLSATAGNYAYLYLYLPAGTQQLRITSSGGTGNADLYYSNSTWATTTTYTSRSTGADNDETLTVNNPAVGWNYISLAAAEDFSGVTVKAEY
ncbi:collagenase [Streptomyces chumphonensis]|uniref:microbial collagenase n=1 Tax=Streptomyces chumphonensis TaxID=1214925 RepID=A0A927IC93_9ACTN|nr:collagenase [Streptomyces chumphonensis]